MFICMYTAWTKEHPSRSCNSKLLILFATTDFPLLQMLDREKVHLTPLSMNPRAENSSKQGNMHCVFFSSD